MATFTMELNEVLENTKGYMGLDDYPIFDEEHREVLNEKIKRHYHYQEIGSETIDQFVFRMKTKMGEIMPYYNQLYETEKIKFDPLSTTDMTSETESTSEAVTQGTNRSTAMNVSESDSASRVVASELPQTRLSPDNDYATAATDTNAKTVADSQAEDETDSESSGTNTGQSTSRTHGYSGIASGLLMQFRETILNIDMMIIEDLSDLFMGIWNNSDAYTPGTSLYSINLYGGMY